MRQMGSNSIMPRSMDLRKIEKKIGGNLQRKAERKIFEELKSK